MRRYVGPLGLDILDTLSGRPGLTAEEIRLDTGHVSSDPSDRDHGIRQALRALERQGLVERASGGEAKRRPDGGRPRGRRRYVWRITTEGRDALRDRLARGRVPGVPMRST